ncbi:MAG: glycosyltransferase family 2 protein [Candidatus Altiarchaeota archaeon]
MYTKTKLVVVIPAFNEEQTIGNVIKEIPRKIEGISEIEVLVVDDGSTDNTQKVSQEAGADVIIQHSRNMGLGNSFSDGIQKALSMGADFIVTLDADGQFNPTEIPILLKNLLYSDADVVLGSRFLDKELEPKMPLTKKIGNKLFTHLVNYLTHQKFFDAQCGFRVYSREAALNINSFGTHTYTQEVIITLAKKGFKIIEIPCTVSARKFGKSKIADNVLLYGLKASTILIQTARDYSPILFFGSIGLAFLFLGSFINALLFIRWIFTGLVHPYRSLVTLAGLSMVLGFVFLILSFIVDMLDRHRRMLDEILYETRKNRKT